MRALKKFIPMALACLALMICVVSSSRADSADIENLVFTGTATCEDPSCAGFGNGPLTGTYSLDVDTQTIVGPWSFFTPFGVISSTDAGASAGIFNPSGDYESVFAEDTSSPAFFEFVHLWFPGTDPQEIGALDPLGSSNACYNLPGTESCTPGYDVTGSTALAAPEPSSLMLLGVGMLGLLGVSLKRSLLTS
jgi:hypothetical protein